MGRFILKIRDDKSNKDYYMEWSTIVDAPVTYGMSLTEFKEYYQQEYGRSGVSELDARLSRVEACGVSAFPPYDDYRSYFEYNRAGGNETTLNKEQILEKYCRLQHSPK